MRGRASSIFSANTGFPNLNSFNGSKRPTPDHFGVGFAPPFVGRVIGSDERRACQLEMGLPSEPEGYPDTTGHAAHTRVLAQEAEAKHLRRPPKKRPNFAKLAVASPFQTDWLALVESWSAARGLFQRASRCEARRDVTSTDASQMRDGVY